MPRGRKPNPKPSDLSIAELRALLAKKVADAAKRLPGLKKHQAALQSEISELDAEIGAIEGTAPSAPKRGRKPGSKKRGRPAGAIRAAKAAKPKGRRAGKGGRVTIPMAITQVLTEAEKPMKISEIKDAIWEKGLLSKYSKSFPQQVAIALSKGFKKIERGIYSL